MEGFHSRTFDTRGGFTFPPEPTFPQASLRSRTVGFPESGSGLGPASHLLDVGLPLFREAEASARIHPEITRFPLQPRPDTSLVETPVLSPDTRRALGTTECPEPLCLAWVLPAPGQRSTSPQWALPHLPRSYRLMRQSHNLSLLSFYL